MKKVLLLLTLLIMCGTAMAEMDKTPSRLEIQIKDAILPGSVDQMRSLIPVTTAFIDNQMECIEVEINFPVGTVNIVITNIYGQAVAGTTIDSDATPYITLPMPVPGMYRLTISGPEYLGEAEFLIEE